MVNNRKLVLSGIALTMARLPPKKNAAAANRVRDEVEHELIESDFLKGGPFLWIGLTIRYGLIDEVEPHYEKIDPKDGELPLAIEIDVHRLLDATEDEMASIYRRATLLALIDAGEKYQRPSHRLRELLEASSDDSFFV